MKKDKYTDEPIEFELIEDFLPSPDELIEKEENIKVTLQLSKKSVNFFKKYAKKKNGKYQSMIRKVVDGYANKYENR